MNILKNNSYYFMKLITVCELIILLMSRDIKTRYNGNLLNYMMVLAVPLVWISITVISFQYLNRSVPISTDDISFVIAGILPYLLFRYTITATMRTHSFSTSLAVVSQVKKRHVIFSLAAIEFVNAVIIYIIISLINFLIFSRWEAQKPFLIFEGMVIAWLLGLSFGYFCDALSERFPLVYKAVPVMLRPMFLISAVFYTANELPYSLLSIFSWNPLLHANEIVREGMFEGYHSLYLEPFYPLAFSATLFLAGLIFHLICDTENN